MTMAAFVSLDEVPIFAELTAKKREGLGGLCTLRHYAAGDVIVPMGAGPSGEVAFVLKGSVRVGAPVGEQGRITFEDLGVGGHYGALTALNAEVPLGNVIAREDCTLAILPAPEFIKILSQNGKAAVALLQDLASRLADASQRRDAQATGNHIQRVFAELLKLAEPVPDRSGAWMINPMPKHRDLADRAETTEDNAAAAVAHLIRTGLARRRFPAFELLDRARIRALCDLR